MSVFLFKKDTGARRKMVGSAEFYHRACRTPPLHKKKTPKKKQKIKKKKGGEERSSVDLKSTKLPEAQSQPFPVMLQVARVLATIFF